MKYCKNSCGKYAHMNRATTNSEKNRINWTSASRRKAPHPFTTPENIFSQCPRCKKKPFLSLRNTHSISDSLSLMLQIPFSTMAFFSLWNVKKREEIPIFRPPSPLLPRQELTFNDGLFESCLTTGRKKIPLKGTMPDLSRNTHFRDSDKGDGGIAVGDAFGVWGHWGMCTN